ncbi:hypothetical protein QTP86_003944 [Hemibagrus guttatus]|nr:hypothetical protein QTP86_003944 [Hemibagrus guttatus]
MAIVVNLGLDRSAGKMGKHKDLSEFEKDHIVMARPLDQSISKTAALVGCSRSAMTMYSISWKQYSLMAVASFSRIMRHKAEMVQEWFDEHNNEFEVLTWPPNSPDLNPIEHLWDVLDKQVRSMEATPHNLQELKDLLLTSWFQYPRDLTYEMKLLLVPCEKEVTIWTFQKTRIPVLGRHELTLMWSSAVVAHPPQVCAVELDPALRVDILKEMNVGESFTGVFPVQGFHNDTTAFLFKEIQNHVAIVVVLYQLILMVYQLGSWYLVPVEDVAPQCSFRGGRCPARRQRRRVWQHPAPALPPLGEFQFPARRTSSPRSRRLSVDIARCECSAVDVARSCCSAVDVAWSCGSAVDVIRLCGSAVDVIRLCGSAVDLVRRLRSAVDVASDPLALPSGTRRSVRASAGVAERILQKLRGRVELTLLLTLKQDKFNSGVLLSIHHGEQREPQHLQLCYL